MSGDGSDSSDDSDGKTNEKAHTVEHQITNGESVYTSYTEKNRHYELSHLKCFVRPLTKHFNKDSDSSPKWDYYMSVLQVTGTNQNY